METSALEDEEIIPGLPEPDLDPLTAGKRAFLIRKAANKVIMLKVLRDLGKPPRVALPSSDDMMVHERGRRETLLPQGGYMARDDSPHSPAEMALLGEDEAPVTGRRVPPLIVPHYSPFKAVWDWIILLLVLYTAIVTPYVAAFLLVEQAVFGDKGPRRVSGYEEIVNVTSAVMSSVNGTLTGGEGQGDVPLAIIDLLLDIMFIADILINFRTTYISDGEIITDPRKIARNYAKGWFVIDAVAAIPFDLIFSGLGTSETMKVMGVLKTARLLRMLRVARRLDQYSEYGAAVVLLLLMGTFALAGHWLACIFYAIAVIEQSRLQQPIRWIDNLANYTTGGAILTVNDTLTWPDLRSCYITSLYYTFTAISSIGFGNVAAQTTPEKIFAIFAMLIGSLMNAAIFGNVSNIMLRLYRGAEEYHELQQSIKEFIRFHRLPKPLASRLMDTHQHTYTYTNGIDMPSVLKIFPEVIQADICLHINRNLVNSCPAFRNASPGCLRALSMKFKTTHSPPNDTFIHPGDIIDSIYFIARGKIQIVKDDVIMAVLGKDDIFGEHVNAYSPRLKTSLTKSGYRISALTYCDLNKILLADLHEILEVYPEFAADFSKKFRVTFNLKEDTPVGTPIKGSLLTTPTKRAQSRSRSPVGHRPFHIAQPHQQQLPHQQAAPTDNVSPAINISQLKRRRSSWKTSSKAHSRTPSDIAAEFKASTPGHEAPAWSGAERVMPIRQESGPNSSLRNRFQRQSLVMQHSDDDGQSLGRIAGGVRRSLIEGVSEERRPLSNQLASSPSISTEGQGQGHIRNVQDVHFHLDIINKRIQKFESDFSGALETMNRLVAQMNVTRQS